MKASAKTTPFLTRILASILCFAFMPAAYAQTGMVYEKVFESATFKILTVARYDKLGLLIVTPCEDCAQLNLKYNKTTTIHKGKQSSHKIHLLKKAEGKSVGILYLPKTMFATQIILP